MTKKKSHKKERGFLDEHEIENKIDAGLRKVAAKVTQEIDVRKDFKMWYKPGDHDESTYGHHELVPDGMYYTCDTLVDEYITMILRTPKSSNPNVGLYGDLNTFYFKKRNTPVIFAVPSPFQKPDFKRILMTDQQPVLVPVHKFIASPELYKTNNPAKLTALGIDDVCLVDKEELDFTFDGKHIYGCCVVRNEALEVTGVPKENIFGIPESRFMNDLGTMRIQHVGLYVLLRRELFSAGDHLITLKYAAPNYEVDSKMLITALVPPK